MAYGYRPVVQPLAWSRLWSHSIAENYLMHRLHQHHPPLPAWYRTTINRIIGGIEITGAREGDGSVIRLGGFSTTPVYWQSTPMDQDKVGLGFRVKTFTTKGRTVEIWRTSAYDPSIMASATTALPRSETINGHVYYNDGKSYIRTPGPDKPFEWPDNRKLRPMPMELMFSQQSQAPPPAGYPEGLLELQCYTFWHYCCVREDAGPLKNGYARLVQKSAAGQVTEDVFRECMGMGFREMEHALFEYVSLERRKKTYSGIEAGMAGDMFANDLPLRKATQAEVARIKGAALAYQGKYDLARQLMLTVYDRQKADPALCASLGVLEYHAGDLEKARPLLAVATRSHVRNAEAFRTLARIKLDDALGPRKNAQPDLDRRLTTPQAAEIYILLSKARKLPPFRAETYALLTETLASSNEQATPGQTEFLKEGQDWFPDGKNPEPYRYLSEGFEFSANSH